jgi:hypothetical protein
MSNNNYYVVIVPHGDQAAQALASVRVTGQVHASGREPSLLAVYGRATDR